MAGYLFHMHSKLLIGIDVLDLKNAHCFQIHVHPTIHRAAVVFMW